MGLDLLLKVTQQLPDLGIMHMQLITFRSGIFMQNLMFCLTLSIMSPPNVKQNESLNFRAN